MIQKNQVSFRNVIFAMQLCYGQLSTNKKESSGLAVFAVGPEDSLCLPSELNDIVLLLFFQLLA